MVVQLSNQFACRNLIHVAADAGIYTISCPNLGKPIQDPLPVTQWSLPRLNEGAT
jgi:hypothetical protein